MSPKPTFSFVIPMYNEEIYIEACLQALLAQDYPKEKMEIIIVDGMSTDRSVEMIKPFQEKWPMIKVLQNPGGRIAVGINLGIRAACGEIIGRMDAHSKIKKDYVSTCVEYLSKRQFVNVGGILDIKGRGYWGGAIAAAMGCPFGVGNARFRYSKKEELSESGWPGVFWKTYITEIGGYDEFFLVNEDDELDFRIRLRGDKILKTPRLPVIYYCRDSLVKLWVQYLRYGYWKVEVIKKHGRPSSFRHLVPAAFVSFNMVFIILSFFYSIALYSYLTVMGIYGMLNFYYSFRIAFSGKCRYLIALPLVFPVFHLSYGLGFIWRLLKK